jgi:KaiC/GvpD/RAD55 family RecA-like ATPase
MLPPSVPRKTPTSEKLVFDCIRLDPGAKDWIVLHSVGLTKTNRGPYGEIDYVVLIPGKGIVCLEVKGGIVRCSKGVWTTTTHHTRKTSTLKISPYHQARESMFSLKKSIEERFGRLDPASRCPMSYAVVFPAVEAPPRSPGEEVWETIDTLDLQGPISKKILQNISGARKKLTSRIDPESSSPKTISAIRQYLRPDFERIVTRASTIRQTEERLIALTEAQYNYLDIAEQNERIIVEGAAGTGKTVLAIEHARREAAKGRRTLFLCFNKVLAKWLSQQFTNEATEFVQVSSFYALMAKLIGDSSLQEDFDAAKKESSNAELYGTLYQMYAEMALSENGEPFDSLVIDEAQDLASDANMPVLNMLLKNTMRNGRWAVFGDFTSQAIYATSKEAIDGSSIRSLFKKYCDSLTNIPLRINCRNTKQIGEETALLSGFEALPYRLAHAEGMPVDYRYWKNAQEEKDQLTQALKMLLDGGVKPEDIVVLAPTRYENSSVSNIPGIDGVPVIDLAEVDGEPGRCIIFSTIHAFKGMESPVVVLCGISDISGDGERALFYVGMSRARSQLILVANVKLKKRLPELTMKRLSEEWNS